MLNSSLKRFIKTDPYSILGIAPGSTREEIKAAYYKIAKKYHPDINSNYTEYFRQVNQAYKEIQHNISPIPPIPSAKSSVYQPRPHKRQKPTPDIKGPSKSYVLFETLTVVGLAALVIFRLIIVVNAKNNEILLDMHNKYIKEQEDADDSEAFEEYCKDLEIKARRDEYMQSK